MVRVSNSIVVFVNTMVLLLGLISLFLGIYFVVVNNRSNSSSHCRKVLTNPLLILGGFLVTVSLLGLIGSLFKKSCFMFVYLGVMFLSILCLIGFTVFVFLITNTDSGKAFSEREFFVKERKTMDFSHWLQNHFVNDKNWNRIKSCLIDARVCTNGRNANGVNYKALVFFKKTFPLPAIQVHTYTHTHIYMFVERLDPPRKYFYHNQVFLPPRPNDKNVSLVDQSAFTKFPESVQVSHQGGKIKSQN